MRSLNNPKSSVQIGGEQERGMADRSGKVVSREANQPTFATGRTTGEVGEEDQDTLPGRGGLVVAALGVVFGDIGTSPSTRFASASTLSTGWR